jgi:hypothetical protein
MTISNFTGSSQRHYVCSHAILAQMITLKAALKTYSNCILQKEGFEEGVDGLTHKDHKQVESRASIDQQKANSEPTVSSQTQSLITPTDYSAYSPTYTR